MIEFNLGFLCGGLFAVIGFIVLASISSNATIPVNDFPPRKPPVIVQGNECYIDGMTIAPSDAVFLTMKELK
jgi:hypothetical protein